MENTQDIGEVVWMVVKYWLAKMVDGTLGAWFAKTNIILEEFRLVPIIKKSQIQRKVVWEKPLVG